MDDTPHLSLPYLQAAQAQKHVTVNESLAALDAVVQLAVLDRNLTSPPASPADGDRYIVAAAATDEWAGQSDNIAIWRDGGWAFYPPQLGWRVWLTDEDTLAIWTGAAWSDAWAQSISNAALVGVNATADATNRLAVASAASLFSHDGAGHQLKLNKASPADTASILFQTGFSGRAEYGLTGDDNLHVKVSADGAAWTEALVIDKSTGNAGFGTSAPTVRLTVSANAAALAAPPTGSLIHVANADTVATRIAMDSFAVGSYLNFRRANNTGASPGAILANDALGGFNWFGYGASAYSSVSVGELSAFATENWSNTAQGLALVFKTAPNGSTAKAERFRVDQDGALNIRANAQVLVDANGLVGLRSYTVATLPSASVAARMIYVSDESGGAVMAFSDGTNWRRVTDRAVVS